MVSSITGFPVQYNRRSSQARFAHESGIHQDGMLKHRETYEIMTPEDVGVPSTSLMHGQAVRRNAFRDKLDALGYVLEPAALNECVQALQISAAEKHVFDEDIGRVGR